MLLIVLFSVGCNIETEPGPNSCSPSYTAPSAYGTFTAQQAGKGARIQWAIYPNIAAARYIAYIYARTFQADFKDQAYAPHGSVSSTDLIPRSGQIFSITDRALDAFGNTLLTFSLRCTIA